MAPKRDIYGNIKSYFQAAPGSNDQPRNAEQPITRAIPSSNTQIRHHQQRKPAEGSPEWQKGATKLLADMMSGANIAVSQTLDSPYFAALLRSLNPNFKMPTLEEIQAEQRAAGIKQSEMDEKMSSAEMMEGAGFHECFWGTCPRSCPNYGRDGDSSDEETKEEASLEEREERLTFEEMENVVWHKCFWGVCPKECVNYGRDGDTSDEDSPADDDVSKA